MEEEDQEKKKWELNLLLHCSVLWPNWKGEVGKNSVRLVGLEKREVYIYIEELE